MMTMTVKVKRRRMRKRVAVRVTAVQAAAGVEVTPEAEVGPKAAVCQMKMMTRNNALYMKLKQFLSFFGRCFFLMIPTSHFGTFHMSIILVPLQSFFFCRQDFLVYFNVEKIEHHKRNIE